MLHSSLKMTIFRLQMRPWLYLLLSPLIFCLSMILSVNSSLASDEGEEVYLSRDIFLSKAFDDLSGQEENIKPYTTKVLWLTKTIKQELIHHFDYQLRALRVRYWLNGERSAWILEEIGKERPITFGLVVDDQKVQSVDVLVYRESRGGEVRYPFFTEQFIDASLVKKKSRHKLSVDFDGITGATLSVRATEKVAKVALFLDQLRRIKIHESS